MTGSRFPERIDTPRLILRPPTTADAPAILDAVTASYAELHEWMEWARGAYDLSEAEAFCEAMRRAMEAEREFPVLLTQRDDGRIIGSMGLINANWEVPKFEIGYWLHSDYVGQGYCSEAVRALTRYAFEELKAKRVEIRMDDRNARSWAVAQRLGFEWEAVHRADRRDNQGRLSDTRWYAMFELGRLR